MQDPKFAFGSDDILYRRENGEALPADEPMVVLRGKDEVAVFAMIRYAEIMEQFPGSALAREHAAGMRARVEAFTRWQRDNPGRTGMGCHSCSDPACREHLPLHRLGLGYGP